MRKLNVQKNKIKRVHLRLKKRDKKLFRSCIRALENNKKGKAKICANEVAEVKKILDFLHDVELAIERVIIRMKTMRELSDIIVDLKPALRTLRGVSEELFDVLPDVSSELNTVNEAISETLYSTQVRTDGSSLPVDHTTPGGEEVLKEVSKHLGQKTAEKLPEPPTTQPPASQPGEKTEEKTPVKQMVALSAVCSQSVSDENGDTDEFSSRNIFSFKETEAFKESGAFKETEYQRFSLKEIKNRRLENDLLDYVKDNQGKLDLGQCCVDLEASYREIEDALHRLDDKGKIVLENDGNRN